MNVEEVSC